MLESIQEPILRAGLVDLDATFLVQLALFIVFALILNKKVVQPMVRTHEARHDRMAGARAEAERMDLRASEAHTAYQTRLDAARRDAVLIRDRLRDEARQQADTELEAVRIELSAAQEKTRRELNAEAARVRASSDAVVEDLAGALANRALSEQGAQA
ncbi:MAG: ATP synthase F0 subunit B [Myxococcota bacterium]